MTSFEELAAALADELSAAPAFSGCVVGTEYPARAKAPLDAPELRIGIRRAVAKSCDPGEYLGSDDGLLPVTGKQLTVTVGFTLYCGYWDGGAKLRALAGELMSFLAFDSAFSFSSVECGETESQTDTGGVMLKASAELFMTMTK